MRYIKNRLFSQIVTALIIVTVALSVTVSYSFGLAEPPKVSAKSAVVVDGNNGKVLYGKNVHTHRDPASTTKMLTVLIAAEKLDMNQKVKISKDTASTPGSTMGLKSGEVVTVKDLMYGALLPSGNDAAVALAKAVAGSKSEFSRMMNKKASELGCTDSNFTNAYGWKASKHYSSAFDLAIIANATFSNEKIAKISGSSSYLIPKTNKQRSRRIWTSNLFIAKRVYTKCGVFAGKTGTWEYNNAALVSACRRNGKVMYAVVLQDTTSGRYSSTNSILNYSYKKIS